MRKQTTLKQTAPKPAASPPTLDDSPCHNLTLRQASRHLSQIYDRHLSQAGLRGSQYSILSKLARLGPMPIGKLAELLVLDRTALGRAIGPLQRDRLIGVGPGPNGRTRCVQLTAAGQTRLKEAAAHWRRAQKEFEAAYGEQAAADLRSSLRRVVTAA